jgi:hypothetical protein
MHFSNGLEFCLVVVHAELVAKRCRVDGHVRRAKLPHLVRSKAGFQDRLLPRLEDKCVVVSIR